MDTVHPEGEHIVYFCKDTNTLQNEKSEGLIEVLLKKELRDYTLEEIMDIMKDVVTGIIKK